MCLGNSAPPNPGNPRLLRTGRRGFGNPRPLPKLFLLSLKVDQGAARAAGRRVPAEKGIGGGGGVGRAGAAPRWTGPAAAGARCGDGGHSPGGDCGAWNRRGRGGAWLGRGEVARPLPAAPAAARAREIQCSAPRLLPFLSLLREILVCGETGSPGGLRLTKPTHVSFKPFVAAFTRRSWKRRGNKGGDAESARLEARDGRDMLIPQMSKPARPVPEPGCGKREGRDPCVRFQSAVAPELVQARVPEGVVRYQ
ncbi:uncharacterized protein LOC133246373 [Bos javanicus]|uniref:uncharacterized protein LOC133246373 n=1 Tax=Bos javanicus TaxID=9906 RepID=UPI002AA75832|nr:uncharacterized protein LOC133246373 [Bos javanicus]